MKVGYTYIQLAWASVARVRASKLLFLFIAWASLTNPVKANGPQSNAPTIVPFQLIGKSIFVEATVNGQTGHFLFDTGAPKLILNSRHLADSLFRHQGAEMVGFNGEAQSAAEVWVSHFSIGTANMGEGFAVALDLSVLEKIKGIAIAGIIGHGVLKDVEWKLDFDLKLLMLSTSKPTTLASSMERGLVAHAMPTDSNPHSTNYRNKFSPYTPPTDSFDLNMSGHIAYLTIRLGGKRLRMGLDTGSERNLLQIGATDEQRFQQRGKIRVAGLSHEESHLRAGFVQGFSLGSLQADSLEVVLADLRQVSAELPVRLDGILGVAFLQQYKVAVNYQRQKVYFWRPQPTQTWDITLAYCQIPE